MQEPIEQLQNRLEELGVVEWPCSLSLKKSVQQITESHALNTNRIARNLSQSDMIELLEPLFSLELDVLLCSYFMSEWILLGAQQIFATDIDRPQKFHRDHHLSGGYVLVLAFTLQEDATLSTLFCLGSHDETHHSIGPLLLKKYPPISMDSSCVIYDSALVHAGDNQPEALHQNRFFITFVSTDVSETDLKKVGRLNGIDRPLQIHRRDIFLALSLL